MVPHFAASDRLDATGLWADTLRLAGIPVMRAPFQTSIAAGVRDATPPFDLVIFTLAALTTVSPAAIRAMSPAAFLLLLGPDALPLPSGDDLDAAALACGHSLVSSPAIEAALRAAPPHPHPRRYSNDAPARLPQSVRKPPSCSTGPAASSRACMSQATYRIAGELSRDEDVVTGWCWSPDRPRQRLSVSLLVDGRKTASTVAARLRGDLVRPEAGNSSDGYHGFTLPLPTPLPAFSMLETREDGTNLIFGRILSPRMADIHDWTAEPGPPRPGDA